MIFDLVIEGILCDTGDFKDIEEVMEKLGSGTCKDKGFIDFKDHRKFFDDYQLFQIYPNLN